MVELEFTYCRSVHSYLVLGQFCCHCSRKTRMITRYYAKDKLLNLVEFKAKIYASSMNGNSGPHVMRKASNNTGQSPSA